MKLENKMLRIRGDKQMSGNFRGYIELSNLNEENIVIEEKKNFEKSIFGEVYEKAELLLKNIREENCKISKLREQKCCPKLGAERLDGINNVISF